MSRSVQRSQTEKKRCDKFNTVSASSRTDVKSLHAGKESEGHLSWCAACCACHSPFISVHLGILCVVRHAKSAGSSLSFHNWIHDSVEELDMCDFHRLLHLLKPANSSWQLLGASTILSMNLRGRRALGLRRGDVVGGDVVLLDGSWVGFFNRR